MLLNRHITSVAIFLLLVIFGLAHASEEKYATTLLQQMTTSRMDGMGETSAALSVGARALNNNPAGLSHGKRSELLVNTHRIPRVDAIIMNRNEDGIWEDSGRYSVKPLDVGLLSYALSLGRFGTLGTSLLFDYSGRYIRVDTEGKAVNAFPQDDFVLALGYSVGIRDGLVLGFDVKSIRSKVPVKDGTEIGRATAMDIGILHQVGKRVRVGAVIQNIGGKLSFESPEIPNRLQKRLPVGAACVIKDTGKMRLTVNGDVVPPFEDGLRYSAGAELLFAGHFALRVGYLRDVETYYEPLLNLRDGSSDGTERLWIRKGFTVGLGIKLKSFELNVARSPRREPVLSYDEKLRLERHDPIVSLSCLARF